MRCFEGITGGEVSVFGVRMCCIELVWRWLQ